MRKDDGGRTGTKESSKVIYLYGVVEHTKAPAIARGAYGTS